jgi:hypothetical protein
MTSKAVLASTLSSGNYLIKLVLYQGIFRTNWMFPAKVFSSVVDLDLDPLDPYFIGLLDPDP